MKRFVVALMKLLLQLLIFVLTGSWPRFAPSPRSQRKAQKQAPGKTGQPRRMQPRAQPERKPLWQPEQRRAELRRDASRESQSFPESFVEIPQMQSVLRAEPSDRLRSVRVPRASRGLSLHEAFRDRRMLRDAVVLGTALAARTPRR